MQPKWCMSLRVDPVPALMESGDDAVQYFVKRDLMDESVESIDYVWRLPQVHRLFSKQLPDGSWKYRGKETVTYPKYHYFLVETWKTFLPLVERYEVTRAHEGAGKAAEFLFSCQTSEGDIRGMLANQYATYYTGAILALLIRAGYENDPRVAKGFDWLLSMRQNDGGWTIPILLYKLDQQTKYRLTSQYAQPLKTDPAKPFSHNWTDMVLRAFAAHPTYRHSKEAYKAGDLLKSSFFMPDAYSSNGDAHYWVRFLFWWPNLVTALESLSLMDYSKGDPDIQRGLKWLVENQLPNGLWSLDYSKTSKEKASQKLEQCWLALRIARIFKRFYA